MNKWLTVMVGAALALWLGCKPPTGPSDDPTPTPSPTSTPSSDPGTRVAPHFTIVGNRFVPEWHGFSFCCDAEDTPSVDEGLAEGWALATPAALHNLRRSNEWVNVIHMRSGPFRTNASAFHKYTRHHVSMLGFLSEGTQRLSLSSNLAPIRDAVVAANAEGFAVEMDLIDAWALRHGETVWGDGCNVTRSAPLSRHLEWVRDVVQELNGLAVTYQVGNELSLCNPSVRWVRGVRNAVREINPTALIGSDSFPEEVDYETYHGHLNDLRSPNGRPIVHNETDNVPYTGEQYERFVEEISGVGAYTSLWFGPTTTSERADALRRIR